MPEKITVTARIEANANKTYDYYTRPEHIVNWNFADPTWHCPRATNDVQVGGVLNSRMEAKDGSLGFDFIATYTEVTPNEKLTYEFGGREATITFTNDGTATVVTVSFDPENENPIELQQAGWQSILNNFKQYVESN